MQPLNRKLKNCVDFCEFPHKCFKDRNCEVLWKTHAELSEHTIYECPKFGCDICYHEDFQHLTRAELFKHIKRDCPEVMVECKICNKDFNRNNFQGHRCLKEILVERLKACEFEVMEYLAEYLTRLRRGKMTLGLCMQENCVLQFRGS